MRRIEILLLSLMILVPAVVQAAPPNLSGKWVLAPPAAQPNPQGEQPRGEAVPPGGQPSPGPQGMRPRMMPGPGPQGMRGAGPQGMRGGFGPPPGGPGPGGAIDFRRMTIDQDGNVVRLNYPGGWTRTLTVGKAAADLPEVRWNNNALVATTVRGEAEVTESWEVTADRSKLIMTTSVSRGDQAHSFKRVYQAEK